ncbi:MAG: AI-2E family transporter [Sulfurifustaceae bacterium]
MKPETETPTPAETFYARTFALLTLALLGFLLYQIMLPFFAPLAWALFIAFLIFPIHTWLAGKLRGHASVSAALLTAATLVIVLGPLAALSAAFAAQVTELLQYAQQLASDRGASAFADIGTIPVLGRALDWAQQTFGVSLADIQGWAMQGTRTVLQFLASMGGKIFMGAVGTVIGFVLTMFLLFFTIRDGEQMLGTVRALIPASPANKNRLFKHLAAVTRAMVYGTGVTALTQGALVGIGFAIVGLPSPIVFGVLAALFALVPMAGTPVIWVPAVLILAAQQRWIAAIFLLGWGVLVVTIDNVLRPYLVAGRAPVGTLTVFMGVLGGVSTFGAIGVFLGPVVLALVIALIRFTLEVREAEAEAAKTVAVAPSEPTRVERR